MGELYRSAEAIESWLSQSDNDDVSDAPISPSNSPSPQHSHNHSNCKHKRSAETTPPLVLEERSMSPKKLQFDAYNTNDAPLLDDPDRTMCFFSRSARPAGSNISSTATLQFRVPSVIRPSQSYAASVSSNKTHKTERSFSPVKNTDGLRYLDKPVIYGHLHDDGGQLPADAATLYDFLYDVVNYNTGIHPIEIRGEITSVQRRPPPENSLVLGMYILTPRCTTVTIGLGQRCVVQMGSLCVYTTGPGGLEQRLKMG